MATRKCNRMRNKTEYKAKQRALAKQYCQGNDDPGGFELRYIDDFIGEGVFTTQSFVEGDFLLEYFGELVTDYQTAKRLDYIYKEADLGCFMYYFKYKEKIMCIDATIDIFRKGRMVNDAPKGDLLQNCKPQIVDVHGVPHLCFFATRDIRNGEELRFDYGDANLPWRKKSEQEPQGSACDPEEGISDTSAQGLKKRTAQGSDFESEEGINGKSTQGLTESKERGTDFDYDECIIGNSTQDLTKSTEQVIQELCSRKNSKKILPSTSTHPDDSASSDEYLYPSSDVDSDYVPGSGSDETHENENEDGLNYLLKRQIETHVDDVISASTIENVSSSAIPNLVPERDIDAATDPVSKSYTVLPTKNTNVRVYDKKFNCLFCNVPQSKLPRHLTTQHTDEKDVQEYLQEKNPKLKSKLMTRLRNLGNYQHNAKVLREKKGSLIVKYRPSTVNETDEYLPCEYCYGYYKNVELWKHVRRCTLAPTSNTQKSRRVLATSRFLLPIAHESSAGLKDLLATLNSDEVSRIIKSDALILKFGEKISKRHGHDREQYNTLRNSLRELGRLLRQLRIASESQNKTLDSFIDPTQFQTVVEATKTISGFSVKSNIYNTPSLALKIGHSLKKCCKIVESEAIEKGDEEIIKRATGFSKLLDMNWTDEVSAHALRTLSERKRNKVKLLPLTNDVKLMNEHLKANGRDAYETLEVCHSSIQAWFDLAKVTSSQIILFNRRRQGEVSKMTVADFKEQHSASEDDISRTLSTFEQKLCEVFQRIEIVGKRGRTVPVIFTNEIKKWIDLLVRTRDDVGVDKENKFLFARPYYGSKGHIRGSDCIREYSEDCGAERPNLLRSTKLRFQIATMSQILNLKDHELDLLADFLGHDIRVHREFYRLPEHTLQVAKISKLLMAMESGEITKQAGKNLDEITFDADEEIDMDIYDDEEEDEVDDIGDDNQCNEDDGSFNAMVVREAPVVVRRQGPVKEGGNRKLEKRPWTEEEKRVVFEFFEDNIIRCKLPGKRDIDECLRKNEVLQTRSWRNIKDCIRNKIVSKKGKLFYNKNTSI